MRIYVHTDHHTDGQVTVVEAVEATVAAGLARHGDRLIRVDVHLSNDQPQASSGDTTKCLIDAQPSGMTSAVVTHHAAGTDAAVAGAVHRVDRLLVARFGRATAKPR